MHLVRAALVAFLALQAACAKVPEPYVTTDRPSDPTFGLALPAGTTAISNASIASVFTALTHDLESGESRPALVRFEGPVTVGLAGRGGERYVDFLDAFLADLRSRAGVDIRRGDGTPNILIRFIPDPDFERLTNLQCVVVPGLTDWDTYAATQLQRGTDPYRDLSEQKAATVIIPSTLEPYKIRECILEEITQALGPGNDLYGLADTVFNDDNAHVWPTALDYLVLRVLYDPRMRTGLGRAETTTQAARILSEINPQGRAAPPLPAIRQRLFQDWRNRLHRLRLLSNDPTAMQVEARDLVRIARRRAPGSAYHCQAASVLGQVALRNGAPGALSAINDALGICVQSHGLGDIRIAHLRLLKADAQHADRRFAAALASLEGLEETFLAYGQERNLLRALKLRSASKFALRRSDEGQEALLKLARWGAFALGDDNKIVETWRVF